MFLSLEKSTKKEITVVCSDMSHLLARVEETEKQQDTQAVSIKELQDTKTLLLSCHSPIVPHYISLKT